MCAVNRRAPQGRAAARAGALSGLLWSHVKGRCTKPQVHAFHSLLCAAAAHRAALAAMLAFKMKRPLQEVGLQRMLGSHVDVERWGPAGKELLLKTDGMRERMRDASQNYSDKGAEECREVMGRYQALVYQCAIVCEGVSLRDARLEFKWADAFDSNESASEVDWQYERACVIFNLAASISFLATHQVRRRGVYGTSPRHCVPS